MVEVIESSFVVPAGETPRGSIWLSNLDLLVARAHTPTVYFYKPNAGELEFFAAAAGVLKGALGRALVQFYPLAGRLGLDREGRPEIKCTGEGVLFVVARSELTVADFGDFAPSDEMRNLLVPAAAESSNPPLVMLQVTSLKCGGVCVGAAVHHTAADGLAALQFINSWSDIARGGSSGATTISDPFLDRTLLRARSPPVVKFEHPEYSPKPPRTSKPLMATAHLGLSKQQLNRLKKHKEAASSSCTKPLSTFKAVAAHVWRSACGARSLEPGRLTRMYITADARSRMRRVPLPRGYFGNAIFRTSASAAVGEVLSSSVEHLADRIVGGVLDDEFVWSLVDYLETKGDLNALQKAKWVMPETDLWLISWQGLPIYEADFGWGRPVFMGRACLQFPGLVYLMNNPGEEDGGMTLAVSLEPENMERFKTFLYEGLVE